MRAVRLVPSAEAATGREAEATEAGRTEAEAEAVVSAEARPWARGVPPRSARQHWRSSGAAPTPARPRAAPWDDF